jgi:RNA polymerase sigma-70 factor (ECF subfamily)
VDRRTTDAAPLDERDLVERARSDPDAFAELYRRYVDRIHDYAHRRTGSRETAEEITSTTFEKALRGLRRFRWGPGGVGPWLFKIAANELADHHRRRHRRSGDRRQRAVDRLSDRVAIDDLEHVDNADRVTLLRAALDELNPRYRRALSLRHLAGLDHHDAARAMGLTPRVMAVVVHRATVALSTAMERLEHAQADRPHEGEPDDV